MNIAIREDHAREIWGQLLIVQGRSGQGAYGMYGHLHEAYGAIAGGLAVYGLSDELLESVIPDMVVAFHLAHWGVLLVPLEACRFALSASITEWKGLRIVQNSMLPKIVPSRPSAQPIEVQIPERLALRDSYFSGFAEKVVVLNMCWAAKQRYREWMRWLAGTLKNGSKPDRAFRAVLTSGKRPEEYRPGTTRPKGWK